MKRINCNVSSMWISSSFLCFSLLAATRTQFGWILTIEKDISVRTKAYSLGGDCCASPLVAFSPSPRVCLSRLLHLLQLRWFAGGSYSSIPPVKATTKITWARRRLFRAQDIRCTESFGLFACQYVWDSQNSTFPKLWQNRINLRAQKGGPMQATKAFLIQQLLAYVQGGSSHI
jgi:hypothetical protein